MSTVYVVTTMFNYHMLSPHDNETPIVFNGIANAIMCGANKIIHFSRELSASDDLLLIGYKDDVMLFNIDCNIDDLDVQGIQTSGSNMALFEQADVIRMYGVGCEVVIHKCEVQ